MAEASGEGSPRQDIIIKENGDGREEKGPSQEFKNKYPLVHQDAAYQATWENFLWKSTISPALSDPVFYPYTMFDPLYVQAVDGSRSKDPKTAAAGRLLYPIRESILRIKKAYGINAYAHVKVDENREEIETDLTNDQDRNGRDRVELNDAELEILQKLCEVSRYSQRSAGDPLSNKTIETLQPRIPFDPNKRVFKYDEVFHPSVEIPEPMTRTELWAHLKREAQGKVIEHEP